MEMPEAVIQVNPEIPNYPDLKSLQRTGGTGTRFQPTTILTAQQTNDMIEERLTVSRKTEMLQTRKELYDKLEHYQKIKHKWTNANNVLKYSTIGLGLLATGGAIVISGGTLIPLTIIPYAVVGLSGFTAFNTVLSETLIKTLTNNKKKIYRDRCRIIESYINKFHVYFERAINDDVITIEEYEGYRKLLFEYQDALRMNVNKEKDIAVKLVNNLRREAEKEMEKEAKEEFKQDYKNQLRKNFLEDARSRYNSNLDLNAVRGVKTLERS